MDLDNKATISPTSILDDSMKSPPVARQVSFRPSIVRGLRLFFFFLQMIRIQFKVRLGLVGQPTETKLQQKKIGLVGQVWFQVGFSIWFLTYPFKTTQLDNLKSYNLQLDQFCQISKKYESSVIKYHLSLIYVSCLYSIMHKLVLGAIQIIRDTLGGGGVSKNVTGQFLLVISLVKVDKTCHRGGGGV
jgi:hypothetical protein